jgi:hypothetical protein
MYTIAKYFDRINKITERLNDLHVSITTLKTHNLSLIMHI